MSPAGWAVVLDADVLLRSSARDLFLYLATLGTVEPVWSSQILEEVARNFPSGPERFQGLRGAIENAFPRARKSGFEHRIDALVRTSKEDRHVLALAAEYEADLVSFNHQDYDPSEASLLGVEVWSPDEALTRLVEQDSAPVEEAVRRAYLMLRRPPVGWADYVEHVRAGCAAPATTRTTARPTSSARATWPSCGRPSKWFWTPGPSCCANFAPERKRASA